MQDRCGRKIEYIRISITDNCNLKCIYCTPGVECNNKTVGNFLSPDDYQLIAKEIAKLDIGQTVCIKDKSIIAVEAMEGTDGCIRRAGKITDNFTVVKVARPKQDMRFDIPVIGLKTIETLKESNVSVLAVESGKTLVLEIVKA